MSVRIVLLNTLYAPHFVGGAERSVQSLAEALVATGHEVSVISTQARAGVRQACINGVKVYYVGLKNLYWPFGAGKAAPLKPLWHALDSYNPAMARAVAALLDAEQPDLVHTHNLAGFSVAVWQTVKTQRLPLVHTLRDYYLLCPRSTMFRGGHPCASQCLDCRAYALPRRRDALVDTVVGISAFVLAKHLDHGYFAQADHHVVYNSYQTESPAPPPCEGRRKLRLGYLGRLEPTKGLAYCLEHLRHFAGRVEVQVAGRGSADYEAYLRSLWPSPDVHFLGHTQPETLFSRVDLLLAPSLWQEPFGRVVIEAFAHGKPVIGSSRGGIPELVDEGKTGFVFDPDKPETFSRAVERFLLEPDLAATMRNACLEKARLFLPMRVTEAYLQVYRDTLERVS